MEKASQRTRGKSSKIKPSPVNYFYFLTYLNGIGLQNFLKNAVTYRYQTYKDLSLDNFKHSKHSLSFADLFPRY